MNIFKQYGIKEVADVTIYSITRIEKEEFYTPVLFLDTLKISSFGESVTNVSANGGVGNGKILQWNFNKGSTLKIEDALFSQSSIDMFLNGKVMAKMADWTSAIAKLSVANKYGQKHYSTVAFPSPSLTKEEWEIVYRCAQKVGYDPRKGETIFANENTTPFQKNHSTKYLYNSVTKDTYEDGLVAENRHLLKKAYHERNQKTITSRNLAPFFDINHEKYDGVSIIIAAPNLEDEYNEAIKLRNKGFQDGVFGVNREVIITYHNKQEEDYEANKIIDEEYIRFQCELMKTPEGYKVNFAYITLAEETPLLEKTLMLDIFHNYYNETNTVFTIGDEFFLSHILYYLFPNYLEDVLGDLCWCDLNGITYKAMPKTIIEAIAREIDDFKKVGHFDNDLSESQRIDRFETCVVKDPAGLKINLLSQLDNIRKMYSNEKGTYSVLFDNKTMLPITRTTFMNQDMFKQKCAQHIGMPPTEEQCHEAIKSFLKHKRTEDSWNSWVETLTKDDYVINNITSFSQGWSMYFIFFTLTKTDYIYLKQGTVYKKWSRVIDKDVNDFTFIGTDLAIDQDTFSGEYLIVGETLTREQKTGRDYHCQIIINRAKISSTTQINLQAGGEPITFSANVEALVPINSQAPIELKFFDVEEDSEYGGYQVLPQNKKVKQSQFIQTREEVIEPNRQIY